MTKVVIIDSEGAIEQSYVSGANVDPEGAWSQDHQKTVIHLDSGDDLDTFRRLRYYKDGAWKTRTERPGVYYDWKDEAWTLNTTLLWQEIRSDRNDRLFRCDWTQMSDCPLTDAQKAQWASYRTGLRDVPAQNSEVTHLDEVIWPEQPS